MQQDKNPVALADLLNKIHPPVNVPSKIPDPNTELGVRQYEDEQKKAQVINFIQDMNLRRLYIGRLFWMMVIYLGIVGIIVVGSSIQNCPMKLSDSVLITLLTTTTANLVGLFVVVTKYLFSRK